MISLVSELLLWKFFPQSIEKSRVDSNSVNRHNKYIFDTDNMGAAIIDVWKKIPI